MRPVSILTKSIPLVVVLALALTGCQNAVQVQKLPELTFSHLTAIHLDISSLDVAEDYKSSMSPPNVELTFPTPPMRALKNWTTSRLKASGSTSKDRAVLVITDASVIESSLKRDTSLKGTFTKQQTEKYTLNVSAHLDIIGQNGSRKASAITTTSRSTTVGENLSINEREKLWHDTTEALINDFDQKMSTSIEQYLGNWIKK